MESKKTKLTISGAAKKSIKNIEIAKTQGKNSVVIGKSKNNLVKKASSFKSSDTNTRSKTYSSFNRGTFSKPSFGAKSSLITNDFERRNSLNKELPKDQKATVMQKNLSLDQKKE